MKKLLITFSFLTILFANFCLATEQNERMEITPEQEINRLQVLIKSEYERLQIREIIPRASRKLYEYELKARARRTTLRANFARFLKNEILEPLSEIQTTLTNNTLIQKSETLQLHNMMLQNEIQDRKNVYVHLLQRITELEIENQHLESIIIKQDENKREQ